MKIPIQKFEEYFDDTIVKRGRAYFKEGNVEDVEEVANGKYEAIVIGTEEYEVTIELENENIIDYECDCPYDYGPVCKHVTAVLFEIRANHLNTKTKIIQISDNKKTKSTKEQIEDILNKTSHEELKQFIRENVKTNPALGTVLLSSFPQYTLNHSKDFYIQQIKSSLKNHGDRHGNLDTNGSKKFAKDVALLVKNAENYTSQKQYDTAITIYTAILEDVFKISNEQDNYDYVISEEVQTISYNLHELAQNPPSEEIRKQLLNYFLVNFKNKVFYGWDLHRDMLEYATLLIKNEKELEELFSIIKTTVSSKDEYDSKHAQNVQYELLLKIKGEKEATIFLNQHLENHNLLTIAINKELAKNNYEKAISLAFDGIERDSPKRPGLVKNWYEILLDIAQKQQDTPKIIQYAHWLFLDNFQAKQDYYALLKKHVESSKWTNFVEHLIQDLKKENNWRKIELLPRIFITERWWKRLFDFAKIDFERLQKYQSYLIPHFTDEVTELYKKAILSNMKNNMGRTYYEQACKHIKFIIDAGKKEKAIDIINYLKNEYPTRRALLEELNKIKV